MAKENNTNEIVCNVLLAMDPEDKHIQTMVLIKDGFELNTHVLAKVFRLRCTQDNADSIASGFFNSSKADIGDDFIVDHIEAEGGFQDVHTTLMGKLRSRVAVCH